MYFGHPVNIYDTPQESALIAKIEREFPEYAIENPNQPRHQEGYMCWKAEHGSGMQYYFEVVLPAMKADIFLPFEDLQFGAGVWSEAEFIQKNGSPIYQITSDLVISPLVLDPSRKLTVEETRERVYKK